MLVGIRAGAFAIKQKRRNKRTQVWHSLWPEHWLHVGLFVTRQKLNIFHTIGYHYFLHRNVLYFVVILFFRASDSGRKRSSLPRPQPLLGSHVTSIWQSSLSLDDVILVSSTGGWHFATARICISSNGSTVRLSVLEQVIGVSRTRSISPPTDVRGGGGCLLK